MSKINCLRHDQPLFLCPPSSQAQLSYCSPALGVVVALPHAWSLISLRGGLVWTQGRAQIPLRGGLVWTQGRALSHNFNERDSIALVGGSRQHLIERTNTWDRVARIGLVPCVQLSFFHNHPTKIPQVVVQGQHTVHTAMQRATGEGGLDSTIYSIRQAILS